MQADGKRDLEHQRQSRRCGRSLSGQQRQPSFNNTSTPNSKSYAGANSLLRGDRHFRERAIDDGQPAGQCVVVKPIKEIKESKEHKEFEGNQGDREEGTQGLQG